MNVQEAWRWTEPQLELDKALGSLRTEVEKLTTDPTLSEEYARARTTILQHLDIAAGLRARSLAPYVLINIIGHTNQFASLVTYVVNRMAPESTGKPTEEDFLNFLNKWSEWYSYLAPFCALFLRPDHEIVVHREEVDETLNSGLSRIEELEKRVIATDERANQTAKHLEEAALGSALSQQARHFEIEAEEFKTAAYRWLCASAIGATLAILLAVCVRFIPGPSRDAPQYDVAQHTVSNVLMVALAVYVVIFCSKNYTAARHNQITNRHRFNALKTFQAFVDASGEDVQTKNAVLLNVSQSIFAGQSSGYGASPDIEVGPSAVVNLVKDTIRPS